MAGVSRDGLVERLRGYQDQLAAAEKQGRRQFDAVFQNPPAAVAVHELDLNAVITRVNAEELRLLGYGEGDLVGQPVWKFVVMQETSRRSVEQKLAGVKDIKPFVRTFRTASGGGLAMLLVDRRLCSASGNVIGIRTAMTPILPDEGDL
jgi:PAS domain S-box-containing protein